MAVGVETLTILTYQLRQVMVVVDHHVLVEEHADGVTDTSCRGGVHQQFDGFACATVLDENGLVEVTRLFVGGDNTIDRRSVESGVGGHGQQVADGVDITYRKNRNRRNLILFLARGEHNA